MASDPQGDNEGKGVGGEASEWGRAWAVSSTCPKMRRAGEGEQAHSWHRH